MKLRRLGRTGRSAGRRPCRGCSLVLPFAVVGRVIDPVREDSLDQMVPRASRDSLDVTTGGPCPTELARWQFVDLSQRYVVCCVLGATVCTAHPRHRRILAFNERQVVFANVLVGLGQYGGVAKLEPSWVAFPLAGE
jgi:hypothetical protein